MLFIFLKILIVVYKINEYCGKYTRFVFNYMESLSYTQILTLINYLKKCVNFHHVILVVEEY
jgi:hypothetical protein